MILFLSDGRLGNQIFQYAFLNTLAKDDELIISTKMKQFSNMFEIKNKNFKQLSLNKYTYVLFKNLIKPYLLDFLVQIRLISYVKQSRNDTSSLPRLIRKSGFLPVTLVESDFFQSEIFFHQKAFYFSIKQDFINEAKDIISSIPKHYTVIFVHVRRGDYISEQYLGKQGIDLPRAYFMHAIEIIKKEIKNPYFIFLSDDTSYCECCFKDIKNKYISKNSMEIDLAIMTLCEYGIVSNSSFSWWGAYLMKNRKKVIFPKYWYGWKQRVNSHVGIYPKWAEVVDVI